MLACTIAGPSVAECGPSAIEVGLQDRGDRGVGARADLERAAAGGFQSLMPEAVGVPEDADRRRGSPARGACFSRRMISISADVFGPISLGSAAGCAPASSRHSAGGSTACARARSCACGSEDERTWAATRLPRWNTSTVRAVIRAHSFSRSNVCGTE